MLDKSLSWEFIHPEEVMENSAHNIRWRHRVGKPTLKPDIFARRGSDIPMMGDVKYKRVRDDSNRSTFTPLTREDFHQICTYAHAWPNAQKLMMIYPDVDEQREQEQATNEVASLTLSDGRCLKVFTFAPERWREGFAHQEPLIRAARG